MNYVLSLSTEIYLEQRNISKELIFSGEAQNKLKINLNEFKVVWTMKQMAQAQQLFLKINQFSKFQDQQKRIRQVILMRPHRLIFLEKNPEKR